MLIGPGAAQGLDLAALETMARRVALRIAARAVEARLNADHSDAASPTMACGCGGVARFAGRRPRAVTTALGELTLVRAYYHCPACRSGFCPRDRALDLEDGSLSPALTRMLGLAASMVSFAESSRLLAELAGVAVDAKTVERCAEALGRAIADDERAVVEPRVPVAPTLYLGLDGTGVPMRAAELAGRAGKQPDGSARTREVKLVTVWTAEGRDRDGIAVRDAGSLSYSAAIESAATPDTATALSPFAARVEREAQRRGVDRAARRVVIGDGAPWIWNLAGELFPDAIQIVDLFHAKEHLCAVGKAVYGPTSELARTWAGARHAELERGELEDLLAELRRRADAHAEARACLEYITRNAGRMRYAEFRAQGLSVSSGVVEAGCKVVVGSRLKRAGMHWSLAGANAIIALRTCQLSGRFDDFWRRRSSRHDSSVGHRAA
jgi:Uncharacterised protein family (UPF0236)